MSPTSLAIIVISLILSAFFSGMEIAFVASNKLHIELMKKRGELNARLLSPLLKSPSRFIATMLVGNNIALVVYGTEMAQVLEPFIRTVSSIDSIILLLQTLISTALVLVTAEFIPKIVFGLNANKFMSLFAIPALLFYYGLYFIVSLVISLSNFILKHFLGISQPDTKPVFGRIDLQKYIEEQTAGLKVEDEQDPEIQIFQNALDFSKVKARECMIPRNEIVAIEILEPIENLKEKFIETGFSKIVVYKDNIDQVIGFTHSYELFKQPKDIKSILLPIALIPETITANEVLNLFIKERKSVALVVDEYGGTSGLLTVEDVVEEIFGEIEDEHDSIILEETKIDENTFIFSGRFEIDFLNQKYQLNLPESEDYETLNGLILFKHQSIPLVDENITLEGFNFLILEVNKTRIEKVQLLRLI
ncbi:hemolysin family protein [Flavobacteriales bacterium]|jgi:putative hemolysin|nr:hemolysin family protein [Flavobacteriales bacterium]MDA9003484.1 hemolysin family protein [Flavobacteriales bacterium]